MLARSTARIQDAYGRAGGVASEALTAIRTVAALGAEQSFQQRYEANLAAAERVGIRSTVCVGFARGLLLSAGSFMIAAGLLYGGTRLAVRAPSSEL